MSEGDLIVASTLSPWAFPSTVRYSARSRRMGSIKETHRVSSSQRSGTFVNLLFQSRRQA
jgi:hypothetical protein